MPNIPDAVSKLIVRNATPKDIPAIRALFKRAYAGSGVSSYSAAMLRGQINKFAEGQFVADYSGRIIGFCSSFLIGGDIALKPHTWNWITGTGYASRHDPNGDYM